MATFGQKLRGKLSIITLRSTAEDDSKPDLRKKHSLPASIRSLFKGRTPAPSTSRESLEESLPRPLTTLTPDPASQVEISRSTTGGSTPVSGSAIALGSPQVYPESHGKFEEEEIVRSQPQEAHSYEPDGTRETQQETKQEKKQEKKEKPKGKLREKASLAWTALKIKVKLARAGV